MPDTTDHTNQTQRDQFIAGLQHRYGTDVPNWHLCTDTECLRGLPRVELASGEFHWAGGLTFRRLADRAVAIREWRLRDDGTWYTTNVALIPPAEWDSIVVAVSEASEFRNG